MTALFITVFVNLVLSRSDGLEFWFRGLEMLGLRVQLNIQKTATVDVKSQLLSEMTVKNSSVQYCEVNRIIHQKTKMQ